MTRPDVGTGFTTAPSGGYSSRSAKRARAGLTATPGRVVVTSTSCALSRRYGYRTPAHPHHERPLTGCVSCRDRPLQGAHVRAPTVRLEVPPHESDPASYLRTAWRRA